MKNFDPIDVLFISLISCYLIAFAAIIILIVLKYRDYKENNPVSTDKDNLEELKEVLKTPIKRKKPTTPKKDNIIKEETNKTVVKASKNSKPKTASTKQTSKKTGQTKSNTATKKKTTAKKSTTKTTASKKKTASTRKSTTKKTTAKKPTTKKSNGNKKSVQK